jgi:hypothetical protein
MHVKPCRRPLAKSVAIANEDATAFRNRAEHLATRVSGTHLTLNVVWVLYFLPSRPLRARECVP